MNMKTTPDDWSNLWGTPRGLLGFSQGKQMEIAFLFAIILHAAPFGYLWKHYEAKKKNINTITLQNVDLMDIEPERPAVVEPPVEVQKPKSAFDFIKMALPTFKKPPAIESPREITMAPKIKEPQLTEPEKLIDKHLSNRNPAPEIKLNLNKDAAVPKIAEISRIQNFAKANEPRKAEPSLKLEEVGRRAVAPQIQTPSISLNRSNNRAADVSVAPQVSPIAPVRTSSERLMDRQAPSTYKKPSIAPPLGYERRGAQVSLDQPRDVVRGTLKPIVESIAPKTQKNEAPAKFEISKNKVQITGPLSSRKVLKSYVPDYPAWARAQNIEADVAIRFTVSSDGSVRDNPVVSRTSGYPDLDKMAIEALKKWKFSSASVGQDQWGEITFRYLLN